MDPTRTDYVALTEGDMPVVRGAKLFNRKGEELWLQGANIPSLGWWFAGDMLRESYAVALRDWNMNVIRLPVLASFWFGRDPKQTAHGATADEYRALVDEMIEYAARRGCYTVLDLHEFRAPTEEHDEFWADAAKRYANHPAVMFDLFNEAHGISWEVWRNGGDFEENGKTKRCVGMQKLLDTVRAAGANNVVVVGGLDWGYELDGIMDGFALEEKGGNGIMYSTHVYPCKTDWVGKFMVAAGKYPIFVGEAGCMSEPMDFEHVVADPYQWAPDILGLIQKHKFHWAAWSFHANAGPCVISDWNFTPTPYWGSFVRAALRGVKFEMRQMR